MGKEKLEYAAALNVDDPRSKKAYSFYEMSRIICEDNVRETVMMMTESLLIAVAQVDDPVFRMELRKAIAESMSIQEQRDVGGRA